MTVKEMAKLAELLEGKYAQGYRQAEYKENLVIEQEKIEKENEEAQDCVRQYKEECFKLNETIEKLKTSQSDLTVLCKPCHTRHHAAMRKEG